MFIILQAFEAVSIIHGLFTIFSNFVQRETAGTAENGAAVILSRPDNRNIGTKSAGPQDIG